ncbi:hypothetical protein AAZX31_16G128400 [Glycine max]
MITRLYMQLASNGADRTPLSEFSTFVWKRIGTTTWAIQKVCDEYLVLFLAYAKCGAQSNLLSYRPCDMLIGAQKSGVLEVHIKFLSSSFPY